MFYIIHLVSISLFNSFSVRAHHCCMNKSFPQSEFNMDVIVLNLYALYIHVLSGNKYRLHYRS